ncbi:MAG: hypothetical protein Q8N94_10325 [Methanoregula sp.]|nr:hypothetical protein [Methanoregula sp.]
MSRGPPPARGFDVAIPVALMRGRVMRFLPSHDHVCDFTIAGNGILALVRLMMATRLHAPIAEITRVYSDAVNGLCAIPFGGPVSRELWLYSRYGMLRFFRLAETGLIEIDGYGFPFVNGRPVIILSAPPVTNPSSASPATPGEIVPGLCSLPPSLPAVTAAPGPGPLDPRSPIIRWLKKKKNDRKPVDETKDPIDQADTAITADRENEKPAAGGTHVPATGAVAPAGKLVAADQAGSPDEGSSVGEPDPLSEPGKTGGEL